MKLQKRRAFFLTVPKIAFVWKIFCLNKQVPDQGQGVYSISKGPGQTNWETDLLKTFSVVGQLFLQVFLVLPGYSHKACNWKKTSQHHGILTHLPNIESNNA